MRTLITILLTCLATDGIGQTVKVDLSKAITYNHKLMGRAAALINEQDTTVTPAGCGQWWTQPSDSVWCFTGYNAPHVPDAPNQPWPASISFDLRARYVIQKICLYIENYHGDSASAMHHNTLFITSGTPYVWEDTLVRFAKNGIETYNKWKMVTIALPDTSRYIHLEVQPYFGIIREMVIYGTLIDTIASPAPGVKQKPDTYHRFGTNATLGDGKGKDYQTLQNVDYSVKFDRLRLFGAMRYFVDSADNLKNNGQGLNMLEAMYANTFYAHGVDYFYAMAGLTALSQVDPANPSDGFLTDRKAIDYSLCAGSRKIAGIEVCDNVAGIPSSYAHIAWIVKKLAAEFGGRPMPMKILELGNEFDGRFLGAGMYLPDEMAALCSAIYDGHGNTITYNGQTVGVKNCGNSILMSMPGLSNMSPQYLEAMSFWFEHNRADHKFASDIINTHAYATSVGYQGAGMDGIGLPPESPVFKLQEKMKYIKSFRDSLAPHALVANTETGYDAFERRVKDTTEQYCGSSLYGNSFVNVPYINGQTIDQTHGNFIARDLLINASADLDFTCQFWLSDRAIEGTDCGTFRAAGMLALDTIIGHVPYYRKRAAYYYFMTIDTLLKGMEFVSDKLILNGADSIRVQRYHSVTDDKHLYILWSPTAKNAVVNNYSFEIDELGFSRTIELSTASEYGTVSGASDSKSVIINVSEKPVIIFIDSVFTNQSPWANAGSDVSISIPANTTALNGSGIDPDGIITGYRWRKLSGPAVTITDSTSATATANGLVGGTYQFELRVTDNNGLTGTDIMQVMVASGALNNVSPWANAGSDLIITAPENTIVLNGSGIDPDGTITGYSWIKKAGPAAGTITDTTSAIVGVTGLAVGVYKFELKVSDDQGATGTDVMEVTVTEGIPGNNQSPWANAGSDIGVNLPGNTTVLTGSGIDPDGAISGYHWTKISGPPDGTITDPTSPNPTITGLVAGVYQFELEVRDNYGATGIDVVQVTAALVPENNQNPWANAGNDIKITAPVDTIVLTGSGMDPDGTITGYHWSKISGPAEGTIADTTFATTVVNGLVPGMYRFEFEVTDNHGAKGRDVMEVIVDPSTARNGQALNVYENNTDRIASSASEVKVMPNPVHDKLNVEIITSGNKNASILLIGARGEVLIQKHVVINGSHLEIINMHNLARGGYMLRVSLDGGKTISKKIIKL